MPAERNGTSVILEAAVRREEILCSFPDNPTAEGLRCIHHLLDGPLQLFPAPPFSIVNGEIDAVIPVMLLCIENLLLQGTQRILPYTPGRPVYVHHVLLLSPGSGIR
ncbi:hypothetical protein D3C73_1323580 [compost metagenome]